MYDALVQECLSHQQGVYNFVFRMTYNQKLSEDITQDTFLLALQNIHGFSGKSELRTWLLAIAKNQVYKAIGKQKKDIDKIKRIQKEQNEKKSLTIIERHERDEVIEQVKNGCLFALIHCLPFTQRCAFILYVLNDIPIAEVAGILGKSGNSIRILVARAKATIKHFLCTNCEYLSETPNCRCARMLNFCMSNNLLKEVSASRAVDRAKNELRRFANEIDLLKTLPNIEFVKPILSDGTYQVIFRKE